MDNATKQLRKRCSVCGQDATGFNFKGNAVSCNACKQFFYRFASKFNELYCLRNGKCIIDSLVTRNDCKRCRLERCVAIGMKVSSSSAGPKIVSKSKKMIIQNDDIAKQTSTNTTFGHILENIILTETTTTSSDSTTDFQKFPSSEESSDSINSDSHSQDSSTTSPQLLSPVNFNPSRTLLSNSESAQIKAVSEALSRQEDERSFTVIGQATTILEAFKHPHSFCETIVSFCLSMLPFTRLSYSDKLHVLKQFFCEAMFIRTAFVYDVVKDGFYVPKDEAERRSIFVPYACTFNYKHRNLVTEMRKYAIALNHTMQNDPVIMHLISACLLFNHRQDYPLPEFMRYNYIVYCYLLKRYLEQKYNDPSRAGAHLSRTISLLEGIDRVRENVNIFLSDSTAEDQIPEIVFEMHNLV